MYSVGIIGAGVTGISFFCQMAESASHLIDDVRLFDKREILSSLGFDVRSPELITNTSTGLNSLLPADDGDFLDWIRSSEECAAFGVDGTTQTAAGFVPRALFRNYARQRFARFAGALRRRGVNVEHVRHDVTGVRADGPRAELRFGEGGRWSCDILVVCTGAVPNNPFRDRLFRHPSYVGPVYPEAALEAGAREASHAVVIGSKQSAVDAAILIGAAAPNCRITMLSPSGALPSVRTDTQLYESEHFTAARILARHRRSGSLLHAVERQYIADMRERYGSDIGRFARALSRRAAGDPRSALLDDYADSRAGRNLWQYSIANFAEQMNRVWPYMPAQDRSRFMARNQWAMSRLVGAIPEANAAKLLRLFESGRLAVRRLPGRIDARAVGGRALRLDLGDRAEECDLLVNASGIVSSMLLDNRPLADAIGAASGSRLVRENGSLNIGQSTFRVQGDGGDPREGPFIYMAGGITKNNVFMANYIKACASHAQAIVANIHERLLGRAWV